MPIESSDADRNARLVVRMLMAGNGVDAGALAPVLGISRKSVYERLSGNRHFTLQNVRDLARFFDVDPGVFFTEPRRLIGSATVPNRHTPG